MLQRGLLTIAEKQQQLLQQTQPPYDNTRAATIQGTYLLKEQKNLGSNKERINCLPIVELPQIKIEQDVEYMDSAEEEEMEQDLQQAKNEEEQQSMEVDQQEVGIKPVPQLLEPTSILKTSLLTGAANTLATLTAAAEQIARMPNDSLTKSYPYLKEENKRTYAIVEQQDKTEFAEEKRVTSPIPATYTSILQTALMSKRPATINVAATSTSLSLSTCSLASTKTLHVRTPDQVLKTAVTLATLGEIAAQQEQQQQQQKQQQQQQQPHILVVPQVQRKMCTLPFKKLNFANVTTPTTSASNTALSNTSIITTTTATKAAAAATNTTTITNNYLGSNLQTNTNLNISSCILNTNNVAASISNSRDKIETTTATFFDTNNIINNVTICCNNNNSNNKNSNFKSQTMATQTLKIPTIKPHLVTTQTQTEDTTAQIPATLITPLTLATTLANNNNNNSASSLQTASSGSSSSGLLRTAVSTNKNMLTQNSSLNSLANKFLTKSKLEEDNENVASFSAATNVADPVLGNIFKHVSNNNNNNTTLAKMNVIQNKTVVNPITPASVASDNASSSVNAATNVTVVVFETMLPED